MGNNNIINQILLLPKEIQEIIFEYQKSMFLLCWVEGIHWKNIHFAYKVFQNKPKGKRIRNKILLL